MRKLFSLAVLACTLLLLWTCAPAAAAAEFSGGKGTEKDPYLISSANDLWNLAKKINARKTNADYGKAHYRLTKDIDLGGMKKWSSIGNSVVNKEEFWFEGVFDGNGHTIEGIRVSYKDPLIGGKSSAFGLFGNLRGTVKDLTVSDSDIRAEGSGSINAAAIAANVRGGSVINCHTTGSVKVSSAYKAGGICGSMDKNSSISGCTNGASVSGIGTVGTAAGVVNYAQCPVEKCTNNGTVSAPEGAAAGVVYTANAGVADCVNTGDVTAEDNAAGIVCSFGDGALNHSMNDDTVTLLRCTNTGNITSAKDYAGGIAAGCSTGKVVDCVNSGNVTSAKEAGGIFSFFQPGAFGTPSELFTVTGCQNSGTITSAENCAAGGICGVIATSKTKVVLENCGNSGKVEASGLTDVIISSAEAGGIVGTGTVSQLEIRNCSNTGSIRGYISCGGVIGNVSPSKEAEKTSLLIRDCVNSGDVFSIYSGGLAQEIYAGGIVGKCPQETVVITEDMTLEAFDELKIENCRNTGKLGGEQKDKDLCTDDVCASWVSQLE